MANMKCALPTSLVGSILSFTVHGHDESELNRMREISPKLRTAIDCNPNLFNKEEPLLEIRGHENEALNGVWYLRIIKTSIFGRDMVPNPMVGGEMMRNEMPNVSYRKIQYAELHHKVYAFTREVDGEQQDIMVMSRRVQPTGFLDDFGPNSFQPGEPGWAQFRMDRYQDANYDLRLMIKCEDPRCADGIMMMADPTDSVKVTLGQDTDSERCERLARFTHQQRNDVRDQDLTPVANYDQFEPGTWVQFSTLLSPIYEDNREEERAALLAEKNAVAERMGLEMAQLMQGKSQEEMMEIMQSGEYMQRMQEFNDMYLQPINEAASANEPASADDQAAAWARGEALMCFFRVRLFDASGSLSI